MQRFISFAIFILLFTCGHTATGMAANPYQEGMNNMKAGNYEKAAERFKAALTFNPRNITFIYQLGLAYYNMENIDEAIRYWKEAAGLLPDNDMMKATLLDIIERGKARKRHIEKRNMLEKILSKKPEILKEGLELAEIYKQERQNDRAKELLKRILAAHPEDPRAYVMFGDVAYMEGRILMAERYYKLTLERSPEDPEIKTKLDSIQEEIEGLRNYGFEELVKRSH